MKFKLLALLFFLSLISCDKINAKKKFFGEWKIVKKEQKDSDGVWKDVLKECEEDDAEAYRNMGQWYYYPGDIRCSPSENIIQGSWDFDKSQNRLVYTNTAGLNVADANVEEITKNNMVLIMNLADTLTVKISYQKAK